MDLFWCLTINFYKKKSWIIIHSTFKVWEKASCCIAFHSDLTSLRFKLPSLLGKKIENVSNHTQWFQSFFFAQNTTEIAKKMQRCTNFRFALFLKYILFIYFCFIFIIIFIEIPIASVQIIDTDKCNNFGWTNISIHHLNISVNFFYKQKCKHSRIH